MHDTDRPDTSKPEAAQGQRASEALTTIQKRLAAGELSEQEALELMKDESASADSAAA